MTLTTTSWAATLDQAGTARCQHTNAKVPVWIPVPRHRHRRHSVDQLWHHQQSFSGFWTCFGSTDFVTAQACWLHYAVGRIGTKRRRRRDTERLCNRNRPTIFRKDEPAALRPVENMRLLLVASNKVVNKIDGRRGKCSACDSQRLCRTGLP